MGGNNPLIPLIYKVYIHRYICLDLLLKFMNFRFLSTFEWGSGRRSYEDFQMNFMLLYPSGRYTSSVQDYVFDEDALIAYVGGYLVQQY